MRQLRCQVDNVAQGTTVEQSRHTPDDYDYAAMLRAEVHKRYDTFTVVQYVTTTIDLLARPKVGDMPSAVY